MLAKFICEHTLKWPSFWPDELRLGLGQRFPVHVYVSEAAWIFDSLSCWWTFWSEPLFNTSLSHCMIIEWAGLLICPAPRIDWLTRWPLPIKDALLTHIQNHFSNNNNMYTRHLFSWKEFSTCSTGVPYFYVVAAAATSWLLHSPCTMCVQ